MELIDSHAHIDAEQFAEDRDAMLERARGAGVTTLVAIGTGPGPEKLDAATIIPFDSTPRNFLGARFTTTATFRPISFSGS